MNKLLDLVNWHAAFGRGLNHLQSIFLLALRLYVSWQFLKSGWLKLSSWDSTLDLFTTEYHVPLLPPMLAAVAGTAGELIFPALLIAGLFSRIGAIGGFAVNAMAVISYSHVLLSEGFEAALAQHVLWGLIFVVLAIFGGGSISIDALLERRSAARCRAPIHANAAQSA
jgi:putative oxidoreductase